jgi:hypothetical protein
MAHIRETMALRELTGEGRNNGIPKSGKDSQGSEEMWISGAEATAHKKINPGPML